MAEAYPNQAFRCLLCSQNYNQLRELPCFHTFCSTCLTLYIKAEHVAGDDDRPFFPCPVCDRPTAPITPNPFVDTWAKAFPINPISLAPTAENADVQDCAACLRDEENSPAEVWCTYCTEFLCKQCRVSHKRNKVSAEHKLLPITDARDASGFFDISISENCPTHTDKMLDVYCLDHSEMCCSVCVSLLHRTCSNIKSMEEVVRKTMQCSRETEWQEIRDEAEKMLEDDDAEIAKINSKEKEVSANMTKHVKHAKDHLDGMHATCQTECSRQFDLFRQQLAFRRQHNEAFHTKSTNTALLMSHQLGSDRQRFITREKAKGQLSGHFRCVDKNTKKQPEAYDITLNIETVIGDIMKLTRKYRHDIDKITKVTECF
ncbi:transcription intermediary factor 1-beta-like [Mizuhopecten yessoensis]|nr:transcription intermediary factor 1-beta-like [Mizuhopecten yessoensis]